MMRKTACIACCLTLGVLAASAAAQHSRDPLAHPREQAKAQNQRLLLLLTGGDEELVSTLAGALTDYRSLGKLVVHDYRLVGLPGDSVAGEELRSRLDMGEPALPALAVLDPEDKVLGTLSAEQMVEAEGDRFAMSVAKVRAFLEEQPCEPRDAREVLAAGLAEAKKTGRDAFVYLSAPW